MATILLFLSLPQLLWAKNLELAGNKRKQRQFEQAINKSGKILLETLVKSAVHKANHYISHPEKLVKVLSKTAGGKALAQKAASNKESFQDVRAHQERFNVVFTTGKEKYVLSLQNLFQKKISLNGNVIDLGRLKDEKGLLETLEKMALESGKSAGLFSPSSLFISEARAIGIVAVAVIALIGALAVDFWSFLDNLMDTNKNKERFEQLKRKMEKTIEQCHSDLDDTKSMRNSSIFSNQTTDFMEYLEYRQFGPGAEDEPDLLSCENVHEIDGVLVSSTIFRMELWSKVNEMCDLGKKLDACLQETEREILAKDMFINDTRERKDEFPEQSPYKDFIESFGSEASAN